jgi:predicted nucleic acid-binding protein
MIILDTDVLSALVRENAEQVVRTWLDEQPRSSVWTTSVTVFEIRFGLALMPAGQRRSRLEIAFAESLRDDLEARILPFDERAAEETAILMADRRRAGRPIEPRDTMIAGIAISRRATLATRNTRHFMDLPTPVVDPWAA